MYLQIKRFFDYFGSLLILIILSPVLLITSITIFTFNGKPILFKQIRVGKNGIKFTLYKFRSMKLSNNYSGIGSIENSESALEARSRFKVTSINDKRITRVGKFIRASHIDELPQLYNVLKGDMSLVGPRPDVPAQIADYEKKDWDERISVLPGITGFSQVKFTNSNEERTKNDLFYIQNISFKYDLKILLMTILKVLKMNSF
tara:strand:+ start:86 stop:694 length:609 start_codon:yes stop_codon:yes gene_type:complete